MGGSSRDSKGGGGWSSGSGNKTGWGGGEPRPIDGQRIDGESIRTAPVALGPKGQGISPPGRARIRQKVREEELNRLDREGRKLGAL